MAIAHVQTVATSTAGASSVTHVNLAVGAGADRSLVAYVLIDDAGSTTTHIDSVVFNGAEGFTYRARAANIVGGANTLAAEIWTLDNPSNATANVVATASESCTGITIIISEYTGANNGVGANTGSATGSNANPAATFNTGLNTSLICSGVVVHATDRAFTPGVGTTERLEGFNGISITNYVGMEEAATAGADTIDTTFDGAGSYWAIAAIELKATAAGGPIALEATITAASATGTTVLNVARVMTATLTGTSTTPSPVLKVARVMSAILTGASATPTPVLNVARVMSATARADTVTPTVALAVLRALAATLTGATVTPAPTLAIQRALSATVTADTVTPTVALAVARVLTAIITAATVTPDTGTLAVARVLSATATAATVTPDTGVLNVQRALAAAILAEILTSTPSLTTVGLVDLAATITAATVTPSPVLNVARALSATSTAQTATPDAAVLVLRMLVAIMTAQTITGNAILTIPGVGADPWWIRQPVIFGTDIEVR